MSWEDEDFDSIEALMSESPIGENFGRRRSDMLYTDSDLRDGSHPSTHANLERSTREFIEERMSVIHVTDGHGLKAHRGVVSETETEFLDNARLFELVAENLVTTTEELRSIYCHHSPGRKTKQWLARREELDAKILRVMELGGNMSALARVLEMPRVGSEYPAMRKLLRRARAARQARVA